MEEMREIPPETMVWFHGDELRARVFIDKYALKDANGNLVEKTPDEMWERVAREIASVEPTEELREKWYEKFKWLLNDFRMIPGGRILFGAGLQKYGKRVTLNNCYVIPIKDDSLESIFEWPKEAARTYSLGGGVGVDISVLRPKGAHVNNAAQSSTGSVSFMNIFSETTGTIGQEGRRGALMITLNVDHPDIFDFVRVKRNLDKVRYANISVKITDDFMRAVENDTDFVLHFQNDQVPLIERKIRARDLWNEIVTSARNWAEPGLIFWDTVKKYSTSEYNGMNVLTTNPCSEIPLEPYGACNLGNINLSVFVKDEFTAPSVDWQKLETACRYTVRFLDDVVDYNADKHPLKQQTKEATATRRIGVGFTGLADMLVKLKIKYDTQDALAFVDKLFSTMMQWIYDESANIASEKGVFPLYDEREHFKSLFIQALPDSLKEKIRKTGLRNVALITVPPVGSGSALAGTSSGIEPIFAFSYIRRSESLSKQEFKVYHPIVKKYMEMFGIKDEKDLPDYFIEAHKIDPMFRVKLQATVQKYVDHSISSTVNLPSTATVQQVADIYMAAWKAGCKGITVYRETSREGILITDKEAQSNKDKVEFNRPLVLSGKTYVVKMTENGKVYVTINVSPEDGKPKEVFVNVGKSGTEDKAYSEAIGRLVSLYLQKGGSADDIIHSLRHIKGKSVTFLNNTKVFSVPDVVAYCLEMVVKGSPPQPPLSDFTLDPPSHADENDLPNGTVTSFDNPVLDDRNSGMLTCPKCGNETLVSENGCLTCKTCGYSKCE
ncbi:MAG: adenosylcobalamin-dependent ribonucleoside-diphosphate reductase [Candidatus Parvarchaeota archaeon]